MKRVQWMLAWSVALFASGCSKCIPTLGNAASESKVEPECGHIDGGYEVTVSVVGDGVLLGERPSIKISMPGTSGPTTISAEDLKVDEKSIEFTMPPSSVAGTATIYGHFRLKGEFKGTRKKSGKECTVKIDESAEVLLGQFEYIDDPIPVIHDADTDFSLAGCVINPMPGEGDHCGGYAVTIRGASFEAGLRLFWGGEELEPDQYSRVSSGEIQVTSVPSGDQGTAVEFYVVNPPEECPLESNRGCFWYNQEYCEFTEEPVFTIHPDPRADGAVYVAIGSVLGGPDNDVVAACQLADAGSLRVLEGNGDGTLLDATDSGTALDIAEGVPVAVELGRFDDNEFADAVVALLTPSFNGRVTIFLNDGTGYSNDPDRKISVDLVQIPSDMIVADLNGDDTDDLLVGSLASPELVGYRQSSAGVLDPMPGITAPGGAISGVRAMAAGDFDGLGAKDVAGLSLFSSVNLLASGDEDLWSPTAAWVAELAVGNGADLAALPDATGTGDDLLLLDPSAAATYPIEVSAGGTGLTMSADGWALRRGASPLMMAVGKFTSPSSFGVAVGHGADGVEVLLVPNASSEDSRYTEELSISDVATGFLDGDAVMDVVFGARDFPAIVATLVIE